MQIAFIILSIISNLLVVLLGFITFKSHSKSFNYIFFSSICGIIAELSGIIVSNLNANNAVVYNVFILVNTAIIFFAGTFFLSKKNVSNLFIALLLIWELFWVYRLIYSPLGHFSNNSFISASVMLVLLYIVVLLDLIQSNKPISENLQPYLLCIAILIYYAGTIPTFGLLDYLMQHYPKIAKNLYYINNSLSIAYYTTLSYAFYLYIPKKSPDKKINNAAV